MNDTATDTVTDAPAKETPPDSGGTDSGASDSAQAGQDRAGGEQSQPAGGSADAPQTRKRGTSPFSTIRELKAKLREQESSFNSRLEEFNAKLEKATASRDGNDGTKPRKTFWEAPDEVTREITREEFKAMRDDLLHELRTERTASQETQVWKQEASEAAKLIQSQKGLEQEDLADIEEIIRSHPTMTKLRPLERAEYALHLWNKERGITDKSDLKNRASSVTGAPPATGGARQWTEAEMEREVKKFPLDPKNWTDSQKKEWGQLDKEFQLAHQENRVRK